MIYITIFYFAYVTTKADPTDPTVYVERESELKK
jgi:hypothetical protein